MLPLTQIALGAIFSIILFFLFPQIGLIEATIIFFSSFLIDVDHYIYYFLRKKDPCPVRAIKWFFSNRKLMLSLSKEKRKEFYTGLYFLHGIEILIVLVLLAFVSKYFLYVLIGFLFHQILDVMESIKKKSRVQKLFSIHDFLNSQKLKHIENDK
jgi:hypothetical protein